MTSEAALDRACAVVAFKDSQSLRRALFRQKAARTPAIRAALAAWRAMPDERAATAFVAAYAIQSFLEVRVPTRDASIWSAWQYGNESRALARLSALVPELDVAAVTFDRPRVSRDAWASARASLARARGAWETMARYAGRGDFLVAARVASTIGYYLRLHPALSRSRARAVWVSSDANPCAVASIRAASELGRRTCFVAHGHVAESPPPLEVDLAIVEGPAVRDVYARAGPIRGRVVFRGVEGTSRPMSSDALRRGPRVVGILGSILVDWPRAARAIDALRTQLRPERVLLRLHPNVQMRDPRWARHVDPRTVEVSGADRSLEADVLSCDVVAAGSSSAHLTALKLGVPSVYVEGLDDVEHDYYGFVRERIVPDVREGAQTSAAAIARFYDDPAWPARFARYDAGYPDRQAECDRSVAAALRELIESS